MTAWTLLELVVLVLLILVGWVLAYVHGYGRGCDETEARLVARRRHDGGW